MARNKDPLVQLELRQSVAVRQFADAADELEAVAAELHDHASEADRRAEAELYRAANARNNAALAIKRATRIRELLG